MSKKKRQGRRRAAEPKAAKPKKIEFVARPFAGIPAEEGLVAMMQIIPAATATVRLTQEYGGGEVQLVTLLPELAQAMRRADGEVLVAMQTTMHSGDASRDVAAALIDALELEAGRGLARQGLPEPGPRLQDVLDLSGGSLAMCARPSTSGSTPSPLPMRRPPAPSRAPRRSCRPRAPCPAWTTPTGAASTARSSCAGCARGG